MANTNRAVAAIKIALIVCAWLIGAIGQPLAAVTTLQADLDYYSKSQTQHTYLDVGSSTINCCGSYIRIDPQTSQAILVRFKIFMAEGGPIPDGAIVNSATLSLYNTTANSVTIGANRALRDWRWNYANWFNYGSGLQWGTPGASGAGTDYEASGGAQASITPAEPWLNFNVTQSVQTIATGAANYGWRLSYISGDGLVAQFASVNATTISQRPKLTIDYSLPGNLVTIQEGLNGYFGSNDTYVGSGTFTSPTANFGSGLSLVVKKYSSEVKRALVRFKILQSEGGPLPDAAPIISAYLQLFRSGGSKVVLEPRRVLKDWIEMQATWNIASSALPWSVAGASGVGTDVASTPDSQLSVEHTNGGDWLYLNVTSGIQSFIAGAPNHGWLVSRVGINELFEQAFHSKEYSNVSLRPALVIVYGGPPDAPTNLQAATQGLSQVNLSWKDNSENEALFQIERKTGEAGAYQQIATVPANTQTFSDSGLAGSTTYFYRVRASSAAGLSAYSNEAAAALTPVPNVATGVIEYAYGPFGNLVQTNAGGVVTVLTYDVRGRKIGMSDPDMGNWSYAYNAADELVSQTDAKSNATLMTYDGLGRMTSRAAWDLTSSWTYDSCIKGVGKICQVTSDNGYGRTYAYDSLGRVLQIATSLDSTTYTVGYGYDSSGRLSEATYPTGFVAKNVYNATGYLQKVTNVSGTTEFWQANTMSASLRVLTESLGNGLTTTRTYDLLDRLKTNVVADGGGARQNFTFNYDILGNLTQRIDAVQGVTENFYYDALNRLDVSSGPGLVTRSYAYDALGNIVYKSDVGTYTYGAKPHAVVAVSGTVNATYGYDANGNLFQGNGRAITYTSYNMPATVTGNDYSYTYTYDANHERVRLIHSTLGTFIYLHPSGNGELLYEKNVSPGGLEEHKHYLMAGSALIGVHLTRSDSTQETRYFHHDHLGSLTLVTNSSNAEIERFAYEAFGKRRYPNGTDDPNNALFGITTDRGFTSHEHLDEIALIHMNGRVYDPVIGRFLTPDPGVPYPTNLQSFNRYSYVQNNPLTLIDRSGFFDEGGFTYIPSSAIDITVTGGCWSGCALTPNAPLSPDWVNSGNSQIGTFENVGQVFTCTSTCFLGTPITSVDSLLNLGQSFGSSILPAISSFADTWGTGQEFGFSNDMIGAAKAGANAYISYLLNGFVDVARHVTGQLDLVRPGIQEHAGYMYGFLTEPGSGCENCITGIPPLLGISRGLNVVAGGGARLGNISASEALRIQNAVDRTGQTITLVGSRAQGTAHAGSDWDYVVNASSTVRGSLKGSLPGSGNVGQGVPRNIDMLRGTVDESRPFIRFTPRP